MPNFKQYLPMLTSITRQANAVWIKMLTRSIEDILQDDTAMLDQLYRISEKLSKKIKEYDLLLEKELDGISEDEYYEKWEQEHWEAQSAGYKVMDKINAIDNLLLDLQKLNSEASEKSYFSPFSDIRSMPTNESRGPIRLARL